MISACAVGSLVLIGRFHPSPTMTPSLTMTAPTGTSPARSASRASSMAQMIDRRTHVGANRVANQRRQIVLQLRAQQALDGRPHTIHDRTQVERLILGRP